MSGPDVEAGGQQQPTTSTSSPVERKRSLDSRRWQQLWALGLGLLEVGLSVSYAGLEDAFKIEDAEDFVFSASAVVESAGLAVLLLVALVSVDEAEKEGVGGRSGDTFFRGIWITPCNFDQRHHPEELVFDECRTFRFRVPGGHGVCGGSNMAVQGGHDRLRCHNLFYRAVVPAYGAAHLQWMNRCSELHASW